MPSVSRKSEVTNQNRFSQNPLHNYYQTIHAHSHLGSPNRHMRTPGIFVHDRTFTQPIVWVTTLVIIAFHLGAVAALFMFSWKPFLVAMFPVVGRRRLRHRYGLPSPPHASRLQKHRSGWSTSSPSAPRSPSKAGPIFWVATHRQHHQNTDKEGDPHSPGDGAFWAHVGWLLTGTNQAQRPRRSSTPTSPTSAKINSMSGSAAGIGFPITTLGVALLVFGGWALSLLGHLLPHRRWPSFHLARKTLPRTCGVREGFPPTTPRATACGLLCSPSAKAGTTTTTPIRNPHVTAWPGTNSIPTGTASPLCESAALPGTSKPAPCTRNLKQLSAVYRSR